MADCTAVAKRDRGSVGGRQKAEVKGVGCDEVGCGGGKDGSHEKDKQGKREGQRKGKKKAELVGRRCRVQGAGCRVHAGRAECNEAPTF